MKINQMKIKLRILDVVEDHVLICKSVFKSAIKAYDERLVSGQNHSTEYNC